MLSGIDPYTTSKEGIKTLTKTIALQLANLGVRINAISPGIIQEVLEERKKNAIDKEKIKEINQNAKIYFLTASELYLQEHRIEEYKKLDRGLFIRKPIKGKELVKKVKEILG